MSEMPVFCQETVDWHASCAQISTQILPRQLHRRDGEILAAGTPHPDLQKKQYDTLLAPCYHEYTPSLVWNLGCELKVAGGMQDWHQGQK